MDQHAPFYKPSARALPPSKRADMLHYLLLGWSPANIANKCNVGLATVYRMERNLMRYGSASKPNLLKLSRPKKLTEADTEALLTWLLQECWRLQDEIIYWLWNERGVITSQPTISRTFKRIPITHPSSGYPG
jgi:transposase